MVQIVKWPEVKIPCPPVQIGEDVKPIVSKMLEFIEENKGFGLAGPQVGYNKSLFVIKLPKSKKPLVFVNPHMTPLSDKMEEQYEKCFSVDESYSINRHLSLGIIGADENWKPFNYTCKGLLARVIQHEMDHINGLTIKEVGRL